MNYSTELAKALTTDCAHDLEPVMEARRAEDFADLLATLAPDADVPAGARSKALYMLGRWGNATAVPVIRDTMGALDEVGRVSAVDALGRLGGPDALPALEQCAGDASPNVRKFVALALERLPQAQSTVVLRRLADADEADFVRTTATKVLGRR